MCYGNPTLSVPITQHAGGWPATSLTCFGGIFYLLPVSDGSGTQEPPSYAWWDNLPSFGGFRHTLNNSDQETLKSHKI